MQTHNDKISFETHENANVETSCVQPILLTEPQSMSLS